MADDTESRWGHTLRVIVAAAAMLIGSITATLRALGIEISQDLETALIALITTVGGIALAIIAKQDYVAKAPPKANDSDDSDSGQTR